MTPEEAIKDLKYDNERCLRICESACLNIEKNQCNCRDGVIERMLDELLQYRKIGTLKEVERAQKYIDLAKKHGTIGEMIEECAAYEEIGTVEEYRDAREKQKPKIPEFQHMLSNYVAKFKCPGCGHRFHYDCTDKKYFTVIITVRP